MQSTFGFLKKAFLDYPWQSFIVSVLLFFAGIFEGLSLATFLPFLTIMGGSATSTDLVSELINAMFAFFQIEMSFTALLVMIVGAMALKMVFYIWAMDHISKIVAQVEKNLRSNFLTALAKSDWGYIVRQRNGSAANAILTEAQRAAQGYFRCCLIVAQLCQLIVYLFLAILISWPLLVMIAVVGGCALSILGILVRMARKAGESQTLSLKSASSLIIDLLNGLKPLKAMSLQDNIAPLLNSEIGLLERARRHDIFSNEALLGLREPVTALMLVLPLYVSFAVLKIKFSMLTVMILISWRTIQRLGVLQYNYQQLTVVESAYWSLDGQIRELNENVEPQSGDLSPKLEHGIEFREVNFSQPDKIVLENVSLRIDVGAIVALSGPSGAGKTTIADMILGLFRPNTGLILIDDIPLTSINMHKWRSMLAYAPQDAALFHGSVYDNVSLMDSAVTESDVITALKLSGAWDFVSRLPDGLLTMVSDSGQNFSGGQCQRLSLTRALVRKPRFLILDEIGAGLDPRAQVLLVDTIKELTPKTTVLLISHQEIFLEIADTIYEIQNRTVRKVQKRDKL